jgi:hypothetical protein
LWFVNVKLKDVERTMKHVGIVVHITETGEGKITSIPDSLKITKMLGNVHPQEDGLL